MQTSPEADLRYPIGRYQAPEEVSMTKITQWIDEIEAFPAQLSALVGSMSAEQLDTPYRPGGWTVRQTVHHLADSHLNSYIRFKWSLTENGPTIKAYDQTQWAEIPEGKNGPVPLSLDLLKALHARWVLMLRNMSESDWKKKYFHPEMDRWVPLDKNLGLYAWHGPHHLAQIQRLIDRMGW